MADEPKQKLFAERYNYVRQNFEKAAELERVVTVQDKYLYNICKPERLLDLVFNFIVYDAGIKKIARYQQYFAIKRVPATLVADKGNLDNKALVADLDNMATKVAGTASYQYFKPIPLPTIPPSTSMKRKRAMPNTNITL